MNLSFSEAANGCIKQVSYHAKNVCDSCGEYTFMLEVIAREHFFLLHLAFVCVSVKSKFKPLFSCSYC